MKFKINDSFIVQADSVEHAVRLFKSLKTKDSVASEIVKQIKAKYPQVRIHQTAKNGLAHLRFSNYPGENATGFGNDPRTEKRDGWTRFLRFIYKTYFSNFDHSDVDYDSMYIYSQQHDSISDSIGKEGYYLTVNRGGRYLGKDKGSTGRILSEKQYDELRQEFDLEKVEEYSPRFGYETLFRLKAKR